MNNNSLIRLSYRTLNNLSKFMKTHKDTVPDSKKKNVVYNIKCSNCEANYIGQTKRQLKTRIKEHNYSVSFQHKKSVIFTNCLETGHSFNWSTTKILDKEPNYFKRLTSEMVNIKIKENTINVMQDTALLDDACFPYLNHIKQDIQQRE